MAHFHHVLAGPHSPREGTTKHRFFLSFFTFFSFSLLFGAPTIIIEHKQIGEEKKKCVLNNRILIYELFLVRRTQRKQGTNLHLTLVFVFKKESIRLAYMVRLRFVFGGAGPMYIICIYLLPINFQHRTL